MSDLSLRIASHMGMSSFNYEFNKLHLTNQLLFSLVLELSEKVDKLEEKLKGNE